MNWKKYGIYHLRWQSGWFVATPVLYVCIDILHLPIWMSVIIFQFVGALVYWKLDSFIFKK